MEEFSLEEEALTLHAGLSVAAMEHRTVPIAEDDGGLIDDD